MPRDGVPYISPIAERPTPPQRRKNQRFVHSIELSNPHLKYRLCLFPAPPTDLKLTTRPAGMCEAAKMSHNDVHRYGFVLCLYHQSTLPREKQFRRLFGAERLVDAGLLFTAAALAGCFSPFFLLAGAMGALVGSLLPGVNAAPSLKASESASDCAAS